MLRDNFWFQLVLFLLFLSSGIYYIIKGVKKEDKKILAIGIFLLTFAWTKTILLIQGWKFNPTIKTILRISEIAVPLTGLLIGVILVKKWRPYFLGLALVVIICIGILISNFT